MREHVLLYCVCACMCVIQSHLNIFQRASTFDNQSCRFSLYTGSAQHHFSRCRTDAGQQYLLWQHQAGLPLGAARHAAADETRTQAGDDGETRRFAAAQAETVVSRVWYAFFNLNCTARDCKDVKINAPQLTFCVFMCASV